MMRSQSFPPFPTLPKTLFPSDYEPLSPDEVQGTCLDRFNEIVQRHAQSPAIVERKQVLNYQQVEESSNLVAHAILQGKSGEGVPVAFFAKRDIKSIITLLGIWKAGRSYFALDTSYPPERLEAILTDTGAELIITTEGDLGLANQLKKPGMYILDQDHLPTNLPTSNPEIKVTPESMAVIFYTSGSSGRPKGVRVDHASTLHRSLISISTMGISPSDRVACPFPAGFGWSHSSIMGSLLSGAALYPIDFGNQEIQSIKNWLIDSKITFLSITSTLFHEIVESLPSDESLLFPDLRLVFPGGESLLFKDIKGWMRHINDRGVLAYGLSSTEAGAISRFYCVKNTHIENEKIQSVGYIVPGVEVNVVGNNMEVVHPGTTGRISIRSKSVMSGYWNPSDNDDTPIIIDSKDAHYRTFLSADMGILYPEGWLEFLGRTDKLIKIRGFSVQLEVIEACLERIAGIKEAACHPYLSRRGERRLAAYLVAGREQAPTLTALRKSLAEELPDYMIPAAFVWLDSLPRTITGKINRQALPLPTTGRPSLENNYVAAGNPQEEKIAAIWCDLLELDQVGVEDDFFELGGDSLIALSMTLEVEKQTGKRVASDFFNTPTIAHLLATLGQENPVLRGIEKTNQGKKKPGLQPSRLLKRQGYLHKRRIRLIKLVDPNLWSDQFLRFIPLIINRFVLQRSYQEGNEWLMDWCHRPAAKQGFLRAKYDQFCRLIESTEGSTLDANTSYPLHLFCNIQRFIMRYSLWGQQSIDTDLIRDSKYPYWRSLWNLFNESPANEMEAFFPIHGLGYLEDARKGQRGVILVTYHSSISRLTMVAVRRRLGVETIHTISSVDAEKESPYWDTIRSGLIDPNILQGLHASAAYQGQQQLARGEIIAMVSDKNENPSVGNYRANVSGKLYHLKAGFADLALITGVKVIPYLNQITTDAMFHTIFLPPFTILGEGWQSQFDCLTQQYAQFMTYCWRTTPETFFGSAITKHLNLPSFAG